jgi:glycosyltransferase involved in cell wall biosynthesis
MKDHATFVEAFGLFRRTRPEARAICAVSGPPAERRAFEARVAALGLSDALTVIEPGSAVERLYPAFDLFCLSSRYGEGFPNVVGEAMASGVPAAVTDVGDAAWLVAETGAVAPPGDPAALALALDALAGRLSPALSAAARGRAESFSFDRMVGETEALLQALAARR